MRRGRTARQRRQRAACGLAQSKAAGRPCTDEFWISLRRWSKERGFPKTKLTLAYFPDTFRGMMATRDIEQGEAIVRVPDRLLVTASKAKAAVLSRAKARSPSFGSDWGLSEHQSLAYWVYAETELQE
ncbi:hypothetical protein GGI04_000548, partial [Coemansia thaxteri]